MRVQRRQAAEPIRAIVQSFAERRAVLGAEVLTAPLPARPDQIIEIYMSDRYGISHDDGPVEVAPEMVVVGPQSHRRTRLFLSADIHVFTIRFQPAGFHALFGVTMTDLTDRGVAAADVIAEEVESVGPLGGGHRGRPLARRRVQDARRPAQPAQPRPHDPGAPADGRPARHRARSQCPDRRGRAALRPGAAGGA